MRLAAINCLILACTAATLADEPRPRRHLHQIKELIVNKLFSGSPADSPLETKFFEIPGFNNVVIKAVPKGSYPEPTPVYEKIPPNSHIGIVGSYLGTNTLNETYNALLGVNNLLTSGILSGNPEVLQEVGLVPSKVQIIAKPVKPCATSGFSHLPLEPVRVFVNPPRVPGFPTRYSYKQVNQDGSLTTYTSSLDLENGVRVTENGKTLPFIIDRVRKIPVRLPVPVLPEVSKIIVSEAVHPASYSYQQIHQDGRMSSYMGLPLISQLGPVVVTETGARMPPPPVFLMDRIEKVAASAPYPRAPIMAVAPKPVSINAADVGGGYVPEPTGYSHSQMDINGGMTTLSASGVNKASVLATENGVPTAPLNVPSLPEKNPFRVPAGYSYSQMDINGGLSTDSASGVNKASVLVTENGVPTAPLNVPSLPEKNLFRVPADYGTYSYIQVQGGGKTRIDGFGVPGPVNVIEHQPISFSPGIPFPPNSFSYKQIGDGKMTTYNGLGTFEESRGASPAVFVQGMGHPIPPPHITDRIEKVDVGAKYNRPPYSAMPIAVPVPTGYVSVPSVHTSFPQRPVKIPTPGMNSFVYEHVHNDGSVTSYGRDGLASNEGKTQLPPPADMAMPFPQGNVRVFESPMYSGPFPMNLINFNAVKPSTPVSGSYSYKSVNSNFQGSLPPVRPIDGPIVDTFAPPSPTSMPAPIQGCIDPDISNPAVLVDSPLAPVPLTYSYKQISHSNPDPFLVVNVEDPVRGVKNVNMRLSQNNQGYPPLRPLTPPANPFATVNVVEPTGFLQPAPFLSAPIMKMPVPQGPIENSPPSSFSYKQVTNQAYQPQVPPQKSAVNIVENNRSAFVPPQKSNMPMPEASNESPPISSFSYKQVTNQAYQPQVPPQKSAVNIVENNRSAFVPPQKSNMPMPEASNESPPISSFSYKQVTNQAYQPQVPPQKSAVNIVENNPSAFVPPQKSNMPMPEASNESPPISSFSYKQVTNQAYQPQVPPQKSAVNIVENNPSAFVPPQKSNMQMPEASNESPPSSSFSYKQVNSEAYQPLSSPPQPTIDMEHRPSGPSASPPMINMRVPEFQKENAPSSFSYKQITSQGVYEYSDEFPTGIKTNLPRNKMNPLENPSRNVYVEQTPLPNPTIPTPMPENPILNPSRPTSTLNRQDYLANNPIIVLDSTTGSSFSFKSANADGSTITVKDDGHDSIAVQVEEAPNTNTVSQEPTILPSATVDDPVASVLEESATTLAPEETTGPMSELAKPKRRRVIRRKKPVKHRGDIPDGE